jgi:Pyruvate/2-oxoglutarate dehydrogenase complex, dihydrolipoamide acyltransferase (E2) component, and related enzymes
MPEIQMPKLSDTMTEGTLVAWKKKKGDEVSAGEVLAEIETDKATMEWESPEDGTLTEIYVEEGGKVNVGDKIAFIGAEGDERPKEAEQEKEKEEKEEKPTAKEEQKKEEEPKKAEQPKEEKAKTEEKKEKKAAAPKAEKETEPEKADVSPAQPARLPPQREEARVKASPVARRIAAELGIDLSSVKGTGPEARVTETDVRAAAKSKPRHSGA